MNIVRRFARTRRSAIAVIMAVSLAPLMFLIGIAVDFTFLSQDRTQTAFASQAAATQATRVAAATYAFEVAEGNANETNAAKIAIDDANVAGNLWYNAELGALARGTSSNCASSQSCTMTTYDGGTTGAVNSATPPNFQAVLSDSTAYPPIFNPLFGQTSSWTYTSGATASTTYSYAQILMLLDTSGSMLIGADASDIAALEAATVCPSAGELNPTSVYGEPTLSGGAYTFQAVDNDQVNLLKPNIPNYPGTSMNDTGEKCTSGGYNGNKTAGAPCALACHSSSASSSALNNYSADFYGIARYLNVNLRIDVLFQATEDVIQDMQSSEAVASQLSIGIYNFSTDSFPIVTGAAGDPQPEATADLTTALTEVDQADAKQTPMETKVPQLINASQVSSVPSYTVANNGGDTDLPLALNDLEAGNAGPLGSNGKPQPLTSSGNGNTQSTPQKFMFIVTDGMEDDSSNNGAAVSGYHAGEMTSIANEKAGTGTCSYLKNTLKYTVYVLYVDYYPVASSNYYNTIPQITRTVNSNTLTDYPGDTNASTQTLTEVTSEAGTSTEYTDAPVAKALQACASTPSDFYEASDSASIKTALNQMLKAALASTIRLTN